MSKTTIVLTLIALLVGSCAGIRENRSKIEVQRVEERAWQDTIGTDPYKDMSYEEMMEIARKIAELGVEEITLDSVVVDTIDSPDGK